MGLVRLIKVFAGAVVLTYPVRMCCITLLFLAVRVRRKALVGHYFIVETKEIKRALGTVPYLCKLFLIKTGKMKNVTAATYGCMHIRLLNFIAYFEKKDMN